MNRVILMGRPTKDPEIKRSSSVTARFTLAVDRKFKRDSEQSADFISCVSFGKTAEFFEKYIKQGTKVVVEGRIQTGSYSRQDGQKVYTTDVVVESAEFAESKGSGSKQPAQAQAAPPQMTQQPYGQPVQQPAYPQPAYQQPVYQQPQTQPAQQPYGATPAQQYPQPPVQSLHVDPNAPAFI